MNRSGTGKKRNGYLCMPALILMLTAIICAHTAAYAGDTEAESVVVQKEAEDTAGQRIETEEPASQRMETEEPDSQHKETEEPDGQHTGTG